MTTALAQVRRQAKRIQPELAARGRAALMRRRHQPSTREPMLTLGDLDYGGWVVPPERLGPDSVCYLAGVGEDITFDLLLIARFGCTVQAFDPVPESAAYARVAAANEPRFRFHPWAMWSRDETLDFHAPREEGYISHSVEDLHGTAIRFQAPGRSVSSLMQEFGDDHVDLLKVSAEGSEYAILEHVIDVGLPVGALCVEYAQPAPLRRVEESVRSLQAAGYELAATSIRPWGWKVTFLRP